MNIHEYQAKNLLKLYGCKSPNGVLINSKDSIEIDAKNLQGDRFVVKAQVHCGGRGKGGGIKLVDRNGLRKTADEMFGMKLVTAQTGDGGKIVRKVYVEEAANIKAEYYLSLLLDRSTSSLMFIASAEGGTEIEELAKTSPEKIIKVRISSCYNNLEDHYVRSLAFGLGIEKSSFESFSRTVKSIYKLMIEKDAVQIEINPLIINDNGEFVVLDAKVSFDENALFRHPDIAELEDEDEAEKLEIRAKNHELSYVKLDGNIGCMVNGAGLAMATMDVIKIHGAEPANFLDVGGGATTERITEAMAIILSDSNVKGILVNIFGGIVRCDIIANGIIEAAKIQNIGVPIVARLDGTNVAEGKKILENSGLNIYPADDLDDAAEKIIRYIG